MTLTPEQWKAYQLPPSQWDNLALRNALKDIQELAAELAVYRKAWVKRADAAFVHRAFCIPPKCECMMCKEFKDADAAVRKMREEK